MKDKYRPAFATILAQSDKKHLFRGIDEREMVQNSFNSESDDESLAFVDTGENQKK